MNSSKIVEDFRRRTVKSFMDAFILSELKDDPLSGYDVIGLIHRRFGILVSSGTTYSLLYSLERDGLIKGFQNQRKRVYTLTEKGKRHTKTIMKVNEEIQNFLKKISLINANSCARSGKGGTSSTTQKKNLKPII